MTLWSLDMAYRKKNQLSAPFHR
jgi:TonB-dependent Receptor Plug Domain./TonB dependent receptor.